MTLPSKAKLVIVTSSIIPVLLRIRAAHCFKLFHVAIVCDYAMIPKFSYYVGTRHILGPALRRKAASRIVYKRPPRILHSVTDGVFIRRRLSTIIGMRAKQ